MSGPHQELQLSLENLSAYVESIVSINKYDSPIG